VGSLSYGPQWGYPRVSPVGSIGGNTVGFPRGGFYCVLLQGVTPGCVPQGWSPTGVQHGGSRVLVQQGMVPQRVPREDSPGGSQGCPPCRSQVVFP
jgi:hypothetical protein